jgi:predicted nucleic-acid-binding protein
VIGLDTNILLRAVTGDDPEQTPIARRILRGLTSRSPGFINTVVLAELIWTLSRSYDYSNEQVCNVIEAIVFSRSYVVSEREAVALAVLRSATDGLDLADALLAEINLHAGCDTTLTFDRRAARSNIFTIAR